MNPGYEPLKCSNLANPAAGMRSATGDLNVQGLDVSVWHQWKSWRAGRDVKEARRQTHWKQNMTEQFERGEAWKVT